jgi:hypothetical protein
VKRILVALSVALVVTACGETGPLDGVGERTRLFVEGPTTTTIPIESITVGQSGETAVGATDVVWYNDGKNPQHRGTSVEVIARVWNSRIGNSRFVQSSRAEISDALPTLTFPSLVPDHVRWITSQLVYDDSTGTLDPEISAAFGFWASEPYLSDTGRVGVLRVGVAPADTPLARSEIISIVVPDGLSLGWTEAAMRYELFCRSEVSQDLCIEIAESSKPLSDLLDGGITGVPG